MKAIDPANVLPCEILAAIFIHLTQRECLECMIVSRHWYATLPSCVHAVFSSITLRGKPDFTHNKTLQQCLGSHVQKMTIESCINSDILSAITLALEACGCRQLESLELMRCRVDEMTISYLQRLSTRLQHLSLARCQLWYDSFAFVRYIISIYPTSLISLALDQCAYESTFDLSTHITNNNAIESLHLSDLYSLPKLFDILDHCPKLTQLSLDTTIRLHPSVLPYCSRYTHFRWCMGGRPWIYSSNQQDDDGDTIEEKPLHGLDVEVKDLELFMQRSFQHLHSLGLHSVRYRAQRDMLLRILEQASPTLNHISLGLNPSTAEGGVLNALRQLHSLESLHMTLELNEPWHDRILPLMHCIQDIAHGSHVMKSITLDVPFPILKDLDDKADVLVAMGLIPFLREVRMDVSNVQETSLLAFLERANELEGLTIESVKPIFSCRLFSAITAMSHLHHLKISYCPQVEAAGIRQLADHHTTRNHQRLSLTFVCCQFDDNGACMQYAKERLGKSHVIYKLDDDEGEAYGLDAYPALRI
ncbi:hypothetical protein K492DRAFT_31642 [Lichtheimia hyalospora FSU 10163]|nr:hypothetical protein K492DRAFT_31642 [Lichtheimia hyalospora FSU 10163]